MSIAYRPTLPRPEAFRALFATTGWDAGRPLTPERAAAALAGTRHAVAAYDGDRLVGFGRVIGDGVLHALLADVIVDPAYQRAGIGSEIVGRLVEHCRQEAVMDVQLFCARGKRPFYERLGFLARDDEAPGMELGV